MVEHENSVIVRHAVKKYLARRRGNTCVIFDFDGCLISENLSRMITERLVPGLINATVFGDASYEGIKKLMGLLRGGRRRDLERASELCARKVLWRGPARDVVRRLSDGSFSSLVLSCGMASGIRCFFRQHAMTVPLICSDFLFDQDGRCCDEKIIMSSESKGEIVAMLKESGRFEKVCPVGHDFGDLVMLRIGESICLRGVPEAENVAKHVVENFLEVGRILGAL